MGILCDIAKKPIGVFDSGLGGLTVVKELIAQLPQESLVYYGDTARVPYGTKSRSAIIKFSEENAEFLIRKNVKMIVVACNSSTSYALNRLRAKFSVPIIGVIEPGVRKALALSVKKRIGVIATSATINSGKYQTMIRRQCPGVFVGAQPCPLFVPLVEEGWSEHAAAEDIARQYLFELKKAKIDALILGCTHYPLLKNVLEKVMGDTVYLVDSAREVAQEVRRVLERKGLCSAAVKPRYDFFVSDRPQDFERIAKRFLGRSVKIRLRNG